MADKQSTDTHFIDAENPPPAEEELREELETIQALEEAGITRVPWNLVGGSSRDNVDFMSTVSQFAYHWDDKAAFNNYLQEEGNRTEEEMKADGYNIQYIHDKDSDMQCVVITKDDKIHIGFRGTLTARHLMKDLNATLVTAGFLGKGRIHGGFYHGFRKIMPQLSEALDKHAKAEGKSLHDYDFGITGHSMGGALAKIAALYMNKEWKINPKKFRVATFGDPRVFDIKAANAYDEVLGNNTVRVSEYGQDVVSHVPSGSMGFKHVGAHIKVQTPKGYSSHSMNGYQKAIADIPNHEFIDGKKVTRLYHISQAVRLILDYIPKKVRYAVKYIKETMGIKHWHETVKKPDALRQPTITPRKAGDSRQR